jgi:hypothetical protein
MSLAGISMRGLGNLGSFQSGAVAAAIGVQGAVALGAVICIAFTIGAGMRVPLVRNFTGSGHEPDPAPPEPPPARPAEPAGVR